MKADFFFFSVLQVEERVRFRQGSPRRVPDRWSVCLSALKNESKAGGNVGAAQVHWTPVLANKEINSSFASGLFLKMHLQEQMIPCELSWSGQRGLE